VRIALGYKRLAYDPVFVNLLEGEQKRDEYRAVNPMGYLPCLEIDGVRFVESTAILELLEELHPDPPLLPKKPADRARVRALAQIVNAGIQPLQNLNVLDRVGDDKEKRLDWLRHFISRGLGAWETLATRFAMEGGHDGPYAYGASLTMADVVLIPQLYAARRYGIDLSAYPIIERVEATTKELPFVKAAYPDAQPDAKL
jgi:maleylacetoacetate isomerase